MIQIRVHDESELYNSFDPMQERISDDVYRYLKSYCTGLRSHEHSMDAIRIISDEAVDADHFSTCVRNAARRDCEEFDGQISRNNRLAVWEYLMGILLSIAGVALSVALDQVLLALISFLGTMALREAITISVKINPDIRRLRKLLDPLFAFKLDVVSAEEYNEKRLQ